MITKIIMPTVFFTACIFGLVSLLNVFASLIKNLNGSNDEMEKKIVFDSLSISMIFIILLHLILFFVSSYLHSKGKDYQSIFHTATKYGGLFYLSNSKIEISHFILDTIVVGLTHFILRIKFGLINKKKIVRRYVLPYLIFLVFLVGALLTSW